MTHWLPWIVGAYLLGSVPFGLLIARAKGIDLRAQGSGNIGATNVGRVLGKRLGITCFALDLAKGAAPVIASGLTTHTFGHGALAARDSALWMCVGLAAVLGHVFPIYLRFKGGKGVATAFGAMAAYWPWMTLATAAALLTWLVVVRTTRYVSAASITAALVLPLAMLINQLIAWPTGTDGARNAAAGWPFLAMALALGALVIWRHRGNLARLRAGSEHKIGAKVR
ncbi:MAG: glycerol-3-phosphate 1-O-acyltransferase PlsY [Phycisphaerales bacterium]|nr:glycerol-3-phosphate 1-O-acyltransferase PlsY [Phycisphaerales bacterium]